MQASEFYHILSEAASAEFTLSNEHHLTIRAPNGNRYDPIGLVALRVTGHYYTPLEWRVAGKAIGLTSEEVVAIADASDQAPQCDPIVRHRLEQALWRMPRFLMVPLTLEPIMLDAVAHACGHDPAGYRPTFAEIRTYVEKAMLTAMHGDYQEAKDAPAY